MKKIQTIASLAAAVTLSGAESHFQQPETYWDLDILKIKPEYRQADFPDSRVEGLQAILIKGYGPAGDPKKIDDRKPDPLSTKIRAEFFAYMGFPEGPVPPGGFPGVVLIHGGGGTAFPQYAKHWISKGYAVIMLDWYNQRTVLDKKGRCSSVPLDGGRRQDHVANVANMIIAHSVLRSQSNVNPDKIIFTGLSWGSWYGAMVASIDTRFKAGIEIYCGDIRDNEKFTNGRFHKNIKIPLYWIVGTNDKNVKIADLAKAFQVCPTVNNHSIVVRLPHGHIGFGFECCQRMAAYFLKDGVSLPRLSDIQIKDGVASATILDHGKGIKKAYLCYTDSTEPVWHEQLWTEIPATVKGNVISAEIPENTRLCYLTAYDELSECRTLCGSTNAVFPDKNGKK